MSLLGRICTKSLFLSKAFSFSRRQISSSISTLLYPYPLGRRDPYSLPFELTQKLDPIDVALFDTDPLILHFRVAATLELSALDYAVDISRYAALGRPSCSHTLDTCNVIIDAMCRAKRYDDAIALFHYFFNKSKILPNTFSFNLIINAHCDEGNVDDALQLYRYFTPDSDTHCLLAQGLVDARRINEAVDLARSAGMDCRLFHVLMGAFLDQKDVKRAYELFREVKATCDEEGIAFVASTFVNYWLAKGHYYLDKAIEYIPGKVDLRSGNMILEVLFKHDEISYARSYFKRMLDECIFDSETINIVVNGYFKHGEFGEALETFKRSPPGIMRGSYGNIISRFCECGMASEAEALLAEMSSPDVVTFRGLIDAYVRSGRVDDAVRVFNKMVDSSLSNGSNLINT
ncbi:Pentatricopeptide repeat-containing protein [Cardamine amara subsp. amara]|uniref:Pentatricopeptide repeat-containing protein n=1 Tax=Cardamine amara subsp. amara TaxID=228776 RepID=A0ABD0ZUP7_CARAN